MNRKHGLNSCEFMGIIDRLNQIKIRRYLTNKSSLNYFKEDLLYY